MAKPQKFKRGRAARPKRSSKAASEQTDPKGRADQSARLPARLANSLKACAEAGEKKTRGSASTEGQCAAEPNHSSPEKANGRTGQRKRRRKQVRLSVAMRKIGLDEYMVAKSLAGLIEKLGTDRGEAKVLLEALKESTRVLEPPPKAQDTSESGGHSGVVLRHDVPRPARNTSQDQSVTEPGEG